jgi:hypothetical protein
MILLDDTILMVNRSILMVNWFVPDFGRGYLDDTILMVNRSILMMNYSSQTLVEDTPRRYDSDGESVYSDDELFLSDFGRGYS